MAERAGEMRGAPRAAYLALCVGVAAVSCGAIFTRYAQVEASSLTIAAYRLAFALFIVALPTAIARRGELFAISRRDITLAAVGGFFLAIHFAAWIYSLELTSVALSVVVVNTTPLWVGLAAPWTSGERTKRPAVVGAGLALAGACIMTWHGENMLGSRPAAGAAWALVGAWGMTGYLLVGRTLRRRLHLGVYATYCYGAAAAALWAAALATGVALAGFSFATWGWLLALAVVSQILGHTVNNWALKFVTASLLAVVLVGEPVGAGALAFALFGETLTLWQLVGGMLILIGIYVAARSESSTPAATQCT
ncbi:MAG: DMT family transporter [Planctomycetales bacterium]|nr:DMT family transporter [Planctomycetales bacterium]